MKSLTSLTVPVQQINIARFHFQENGNFPNNNKMPLLVYSQVVNDNDRKSIEALLESNAWVNAWEDGILDYHHYHSKCHEVLVVTHGEARLQFGGPDGQAVSVSPGDVIIIPAGVAHKCLEHDKGFKVIGAYPVGQDYDLLKGQAKERPDADQRIKNVTMPAADPIFGSDGPLVKNWS